MKRFCGALIAVGGAILLAVVYSKPVGMSRIETKTYGLTGLMAAVMGTATYFRFRRQMQD